MTDPIPPGLVSVTEHQCPKASQGIFCLGRANRSVIPSYLLDAAFAVCKRCARSDLIHWLAKALPNGFHGEKWAGARPARDPQELGTPTWDLPGGQWGFSGETHRDEWGLTPRVVHVEASALVFVKGGEKLGLGDLLGLEGWG